MECRASLAHVYPQASLARMYLAHVYLALRVEMHDFERSANLPSRGVSLTCYVFYLKVAWLRSRAANMHFARDFCAEEWLGFEPEQSALRALLSQFDYTFGQPTRRAGATSRRATARAIHPARSPRGARLTNPSWCRPSCIQRKK